MFKNVQRIVPLLLGFLLTHVLHAAPLKTLSLDFTRELTENRKTERTVGTLHYDAKAARVVVEVTKPIKQIMVVKKNILEIYYPLEQQAFRFISEARIPLPFIEAILQTTQPEYGLTAVGYALDKHDVVDGVLYTYWAPPKKAKAQHGPVILGMRNDKLISAEVKSPKGHIIARTRYEAHSKIGLNYIPMTVTASTYSEKSEILQHEQIIYSNPQINMEPAKLMLNFTIPKSVAVKEIKW